MLFFLLDFAMIALLHLGCSECRKPVPLDLEKYLQPDVISDKDIFNETSCYRACEEGAPPKICYYKWTMDDYKTLGPACRRCPQVIADCFRPQCISADGYERGLVTVNHQLGGPNIQVCLGDRIIVDVTNRFLGQSTGIHWHGVHQSETPWMDGVPMVTQCPIPEMTSFRYDFRTNNEGTLYWHSHDGFQKQDGIQGSVIVRLPKSLDKNGHLYDYDLASHVIFVSDWMHRAAGEHFPGLQTHDMFQEPDAMLFNGRGRYTSEDGNQTDTPYAVFRVTKGKRYRFRVVGGMCTSCSYQLSVHDHSLLLIATDGCPIEPIRVNSIIMYAGERYDFVLEANREIKSYWIHMRATGICDHHRVYTGGIIRYNGDTSTMLTDPGFNGFYDGKMINIYNASCDSYDYGVCVSQLTTLRSIAPQIRRPRPDISFTLRFGFHRFHPEKLFEPGEYERYFEPIPNKLLSSTINNISFSMPNSPILSQFEDIDPNVFCPKGKKGMPVCPNGQNYCQCLHMVHIPLGAMAQFVLVDRGFGAVHHPFHLHGYSFNVIAMGQFEYGEDENVILDRLYSGELQVHHSPVHKDTLAVPANGYAIVRLVANNPGYWFFHCHILYHADTGMALVVQVGDHKEIPQPPPGLHKCGNYLPPVYNEVPPQPHNKFNGFTRHRRPRAVNNNTTVHYYS